MIAEEPTMDLPAELAGGTDRDLDNSTPVPLGPDTVWLVTAGEVDLFVVPTDAQGRQGRRTYIGTARTGGLMVGCDAVEVSGRSWHLLAVGVQARVREVPGDWVGELEGSRSLRAGLHAWLTATTTLLPADGPRVAVEVTAEAVDLAAGQVLAAPSRLTWLSPQTACFALDGTQCDVAAFPLGAAWSIETVAPGSARILDTGDVSDTEQRRGIAWMQTQMLTGHANRAIGEEESAVVREAQREELDAATRASAMSDLAAIDNSTTWRPTPGMDPLMTACELLGHLSGITIAKPPNWSTSQSQDPVHAIARASGVRIRLVTLSGTWWKGGVEPILAFRDDGQPVVLVPETSGRYVMFDPETGEGEKVNRQRARGMRPTGYVFYEPMPVTALSVRSLLRFGMHGSRKDLLRVLGFSLLTGLLSLAIPIATGAILGSLVPRGKPGLIVIASVVLLLVVFATTGFLLSRSAALLRLQGRMLVGMQSGIWDRLIALPAQFFTRYSVADLAMRVNGVDAIQQIVASVASQTLLAVVTLLFSIGLLFAYSPSLAAIILAITVTVAVTSAFITFAQIKRLRAMYDAKGQAAGTLLQIVQGIDKVRAAAAESRALGAWSRKFADQASNLLASETLAAIRTALYAALPALLTFTAYAMVAANPTMLSTAAFLSFITALGQIAAATSQLDLSLGFALNVVPLFDRMRPVLEEPEEVTPGASDPGRLSGRIALTSVTYRYPGMDTPVLHDIDLAVEPGEFVGLVGPSGSGKSTIVRLLLGFDRPESGSITYDGKDLTTLDPRAVRAQIGVAMQNSAVTGADILSAIVGDWPLTEDDAWVAAEKVGLADDIRALPMGMRTLLGSNASTFSGGQRQRLVLAAAIARNPRVVILDEATSALDSVTQAQVAHSFAALRVTRLVVAHRLSTIRDADRIVVLDRGRVVQQGTFDDLAHQEGLFQKLVRRQSL